MKELKQRITAKAAKIDRYERRINQYRINRMFSSNQKRVFMELNSQIIKEDVIPNGDENRKFWGGIWDTSMKHNDKAEWLMKVEIELGGVTKQDDVKITVHDVRKVRTKYKVIG